MNKYQKHQQGVTLIELMIAVAISSVLLGGIIEVYLGSKQSYNLVEESSRLQENGRFGLDIMTREIRGAGFLGCLPNPSVGKDNSENNFLNHLDSNDAAFQFSEVLTGIDGGGTASDSISFSSTSGQGIHPTAKQGKAANIMITPDHGLVDGDIILISDCTAGDIFQANQAQNALLVHNTGTDTPGNAQIAVCTNPGNNGHCLSKEYGEDADIYRLQRVTYAIGSTRNDGEGNPINGLFRNGVEIIENVENMQILYGEDTDVDDVFHVPNQYVTATDIGYVDNANPGNMANAVTVRVALLLRGERDLLPADTTQTHQLLDAQITTNDRRLYKIFSTTITVRNRSLNDS